jgi:hypothetical protein
MMPSIAIDTNNIDCRGFKSNRACGQFVSGKEPRGRYALHQLMSEIPDEKTPSNEKGPVFVQPCAGTTGVRIRPTVAAANHIESDKIMRAWAH